MTDESELTNEEQIGEMLYILTQSAPVTDESELKPCPFCGGVAEITEPDSHTHFYIRCVKCGMRGPVHVAGHGASSAEAIAAWNTRPAQDESNGDGQ